MIPRILFPLPQTVNGDLAAQCQGPVVVLGVPFNNGRAESEEERIQQFQQTTVAFIQTLGSQLAVWVDNHINRTYQNDQRFKFFSHDTVLATQITPHLVNQFGVASTLLAAGDFGGIIASARWVLGGVLPYTEAVEDAIIAETRNGHPMSRGGMWLYQAIKYEPSDITIKEAAFACLLQEASGEQQERLLVTSEHYQERERLTRALAAQYTLRNGIATVVANNQTERIDRSLLLEIGENQAPTQTAIFRFISIRGGADMITVATKKKINLVELLGLASGNPGIVTISASRLDEVIEIINVVLGGLHS